MRNLHMRRMVGGMSRTAEGDTGPCNLQSNVPFTTNMGHGLPGTEDAQASLDARRLAVRPLTPHDDACENEFVYLHASSSAHTIHAHRHTLCVWYVCARACTFTHRHCGMAHNRQELHRITLLTQ